MPEIKVIEAHPHEGLVKITAPLDIDLRISPQGALALAKQLIESAIAIQFPEEGR